MSDAEASALPTGPGDPTPRYRLLRAADQVELLVALEAVTVRPRAGGGIELAATVMSGSTQVNGRLTVTFPPQHLIEYDHGVQERPIVGDGSTVAFTLPHGVAVPLTVGGVLAALPTLQLSPTGLVSEPVPPAPPPAPPAAEVLAATVARTTARRAGAAAPADLAGPVRARRADVRMPPTAPAPVPDAVAEPAGFAVEPSGALGLTKLRFPSRLELTTRPGATRLATAAEPVEHGGLVELWHARFSVRRSDGVLVERPIALRAKTRELPPGDPKPWRDRVGDDAIGGAVRRAEREGLQAQTAIPDRLATAAHIRLSPWGAWFDASGEWASGSLRAWEHTLAMGRDVRSRTVSTGTLYPLGVTALKIAVTTRKVDPQFNGRRARLSTTEVIVVQQREKTYDQGDRLDRGWPWRRVRLVTTRTPDVDLPSFPAGGGAKAGLLPTLAGVPFEWECIGTDRGGRVSTFALPLVFVPDTVTDLSTIEQHYGSAAHDALRTVSLLGQLVSVAPTAGAEPDSADVLVSKLRLGIPSRAQEGAPAQNRPVLEQIVGRLPAFERFTGAPAELTLAYASEYLTSAFGDGNAGEVLLALAPGQGQVLDLARSAVTGGVFSPKYALTGLSRRLGPVGGQLSELAAGRFSVADLLGAVLDQVTLFGVFRLRDLLGAQTVQSLEKAPELVTRTLDGVARPSFRWELDLFAHPDGVEFSAAGARAVLRPRRENGVPQAATLLVSIDTTVLDGTTVTMRQHSVCRVTDVELLISLAGQDLLVVPVRELRFDSVDGRKPDVDVRLAELQFLGILSFVKALADLLPVDGFSDPPALDVRPDGVTSSFSVPVPDVAVGVFSLQNLAIHSQLELFFSGAAPAFELNFARRDSPFQVAVAMMGGGGHVGLRVGTDGLKWLEGSLEFGASLAISLGPVARGSVSAMGGVSILVNGDGDATLTAYLDLRGELRVLGLITVSLQLLLALAYESASGKLVGRAELVFKVKVLFFKKTVRVTVERQFAGSNADPTFAELMPATGDPGERAWDDYCTAYAEV